MKMTFPQIDTANRLRVGDHVRLGGEWSLVADILDASTNGTMGLMAILAVDPDARMNDTTAVLWLVWPGETLTYQPKTGARRPYATTGPLELRHAGIAYQARSGLDGWLSIGDGANPATPREPGHWPATSRDLETRCP